MTSSDSTIHGATVVITHRVQESKEAAYEDWLEEIGPRCRAAVGHLDWQIVRPIAGLTTTYTVVIRFDTCDHLRAWMDSAERQGLIGKALPFLAAEDQYTIKSGLDFWFTPVGTGAKVPVRWKQYLVTWSAIYPLALGVPLLVGPVLHRLGVPGNRYVTTLAITAVVVFLMVYVVMPRYTRWVRKWLFSGSR